MASLVTGECGGANPLMRLSNKVQEGNSLQKELGPRYYLQAENQDLQKTIPHTFDMQSLLDEMQDIQRPHGMANTAVYKDKASASWQKEYARQSTHRDVRSRNKELQISTMPPSLYHPHLPQFHMSPPTLLHQPYEHQEETTKWAHEYLDESLDKINGSLAMQKTAKEIVEAMEDQEISPAEFMKFVGKNGENVEDAAKFKDDAAYWGKLQQDWNELFSQEQFLNGEENEIYHQNKEYTFEEANPFADTNNAFEEGLEKLNAGDLISAILLFEEAVRVNPDHAEAWQFLGTSQAENEQEILAIRALNICLELQPDSLTARMALAVSYTNESLQLQACDALKSWIQHNPRYSHLTPTANPSAGVKQNIATSMMSSSMFNEIQDLYLAAARIAPRGDIDADIQIGLGVLFNISGDYGKAVDCFNTGLQARPDSATLWNKLGATLANSGRSVEAIEAYRNALELRPGFIRCRYNLGISCINMKAYKEAVEHFLSALNMQKQGEDPSRPASTMSENIWTTLRMTLSLLGRMDLMKATDRRDLKHLNTQFGTNDS